MEGSPRRLPRTHRALRSPPRLHQRRRHQAAMAGSTPKACSWPPPPQARSTPFSAKKASGTNDLPTHRNPTNRRRHRLPPTQRRPHSRAQLADLHHLRQPLSEVASIKAVHRTGKLTKQKVGCASTDLATSFRPKRSEGEESAVCQRATKLPIPNVASPIATNGGLTTSHPKAI